MESQNLALELISSQGLQCLGLGLRIPPPTPRRFPACSLSSIKPKTLNLADPGTRPAPLLLIHLELGRLEHFLGGRNYLISCKSSYIPDLTSKPPVQFDLFGGFLFPGCILGAWLWAISTRPARWQLNLLVGSLPHRQCGRCILFFFSG